MQTSTKVVLGAVGGVLGITALVTVVILAGGSGGGGDSEFVNILPSDTWLVGSIKTKKLLGMPMMRQLVDDGMKAASEDEEFKEFRESLKTNLGVERPDDVRRVIICLGMAKGDPSTAAMLDANWKKDGAKAFLTQTAGKDAENLNLKAEEIGGTQVWSWGRYDKMALAFPAAGRMLVGSQGQVEQMMRLKGGKAGAALDTRLQYALKFVGGSSDAAWVVLVLPPEAKKELIEERDRCLERARRGSRDTDVEVEAEFLSCMLEPVSFAFALRPRGDGFDLVLLCVTATEEDARKLAPRIEGLRVKGVQMMEAELSQMERRPRSGESAVEQEMLRLLVDCVKTGKIVAHKAGVELQASVSPQVVEKVTKSFVDALTNARTQAMNVKSMTNLRQIAMASAMWMTKYSDGTTFPPSLKDLLDKGVITDARVFLHPTNKTKPAPGQFVSDYDSIMDRAGLPLTESDLRGGVPLAWEKKAFFGGMRNVVFVDSHVESVPEGRFQAMLKEVDALIERKRPK